MQIKIDDKDLIEFHKLMDRMIRWHPKKVDQLLQNTATHIQGHAKQLAPVDTGWLEKNIVKGKDTNGYYVNSNADYSVWVEYGNRWWTGKSYFRPAIEMGMKYLEQEVKNTFKSLRW